MLLGYVSVILYSIFKSFYYILLNGMKRYLTERAVLINRSIDYFKICYGPSELRTTAMRLHQSDQKLCCLVVANYNVYKDNVNLLIKCNSFEHSFYLENAIRKKIEDIITK
ncbi:hypothetical protein KSF78_0008839 [Schistosoma japonicum]|nr:hypothetical protein KSF78_0008839 [Schistosoma japonicum]